MKCLNCGSPLQVTDKFCATCGMSVSPAATQPDELSSQHMESQKAPFYKSIWMIPTITFLVTACAVLGDFLVEKQITNHVKQDQLKAEQLSLTGNLDSAKNTFASILSLRPHDEPVMADLKAVDIGLKIRDQLKEVQNKENANQFDQALNDLQMVDSEIGNYQGPLFDLYQKQTSDLSTDVNLKQIQSQLPSKTNVDDLATLLSKISSFHTDLAQQITEQLKGKISDVTFDQANQLLQNKQFADALTAVDKGLSYAANNEKLTTLKDKINTQKTDFEKTEQQQMEQAAISAAKEDALNHSQAVQVLSINGVRSSSGDYIITGQVKNVGTRQIRSIEVYYSVLDSSGTSIKTSYAYVTPFYLNPGDTGTFRDTVYFAPNAKSVQATSTSWYLN